MLIIPPIAIKTTKLINIQKKTTPYEVGNSCPGLRQAQNYGGVKPINVYNISPLDNRMTEIQGYPFNKQANLPNQVNDLHSNCHDNHE